MPSRFESRKRLILAKVKSIRQRYTRTLAAITLVLSFQFLIFKQLRLDRIYGLKFSRWPTKNGGPHDKPPPSSGPPPELDEENPHPIDVQLIRATSRLPNIDKYLEFYYKFSLWYYIFAIVRTVTVFLLHLDYLSEYRLLICYLMGRVVVNGRLAEPMRYFVVWGSCYMIIWRVVMIYLRPSLKLYCFEFLMYDIHELIMKEAKLNTNKQPLSSSSSSPTRNTDHYLLGSRASLTCNGQNHQSSILQCRDLLAIQRAEQTGSIRPGMLGCPMRLNRTAKQWKLLSQALTSYWFLTFLGLVAACPLFVAMGLPVVVTKKGFELIYNGCTSWIAEYSRLYNDTQTYAHIYSIKDEDYLAQIQADWFLPMADFTPMNAYHVTRIIMDTIDNVLVYFDTVGLFVSNTCIAILLSCDICYYSDELCPHLESLNAELRARSERHHSKSNRTFSQLDVRIQTIQSMLMDFFDMVCCYTKFASLLTIYSTTGWLSYSALVAKWIFTPRDEKPKLEWYVLHVYTTIYMALVVGYFSRVRMACRRLYPLICSSATLDTTDSDRKRRWRLILKHYWPRPLYCFTVMGSIELSWLFLLKLLTWLLSAFVVASSFFAIYSLHSRAVT